MKSLDFETLPEPGERRVRVARFQARSALPVSAACVVANGVRETLTTLLGAPIGMRLFEPSIPSPQAWHTLLRDARLYRVRGAVADAAVVLRATDAVALAAMLFGEAQLAQLAERRLSPLECDVLDRMVNAFAANLGSVCGARESHSVERVTGIAGFVTYFDLLVTDPVTARIGIALSRDPSPEGGVTLDAAILSGITVTARAALDLGQSDLAAVVRLKPGSVIALSQPRLQRCLLLAESRGIARGACGVRNGRYAVAIDGRT
jgi:flagellar motor switch/type III secretory pathway protein FliN